MTFVIGNRAHQGAVAPIDRNASISIAESKALGVLGDVAPEVMSQPRREGLAKKFARGDLRPRSFSVKHPEYLKMHLRIAFEGVDVAPKARNHIVRTEIVSQRVRFFIGPPLES